MRWPRIAVAAGTAVLLLSAIPATGIVTETGGGEAAPMQANAGAKDITIDAGSKAGVPFPHKRHQVIESVTCNTCHDLFPQKPGSIASMKQAGSLGRKQVMKDLCISCHKETAKADKPSGPTSCRVCHTG